MMGYCATLLASVKIDIMTKAYWHYIWTKLRVIKPWYFFAAFLLFGLLSVYALRANNLHMAQLRSAVYAADKNNGNVTQALQNLRAYVGSHMNTNLSGGPNAVYPPIQLKYTYDRLITAKSAQTADYNSQIYTQAQRYCEATIPTGFSGSYRITCIEDYVTTHNASPTYIPSDLYKFDFYSPRWTPDLAGWSLVLSALSLVLFAFFWLARRLVKALAN
jgi:hypothetical protein